MISFFSIKENEKNPNNSNSSLPLDKKNENYSKLICYISDVVKSIVNY